MNTKQWIKIWFLISSSIPFIILFNYVVDPNWTFAHANILNSKQKGFNERQQKTNFIYFNGLQDYDGLLLGSSRSTYINQNDFDGLNIYNYALNSMFPSEYKEYIAFAKKVKGRNFKYIIIGMDFFGTNAKTESLEFETPQFYIANTQSPYYRYKMLFSYDTAKFSLKNIKNVYRDSQHFYRRDNVHIQEKVSEPERKNRFEINLKRHTENFMDNKYVYNSQYKTILEGLKTDNPDTKFIIFTPPVSANLQVSIIKDAKRFNEYERWLKEMIEVFGEVHHFMNINTVTTNLQNYPDDDHFYPYIGKMLANKLSGKLNETIPESFEFILNAGNVDSYLSAFKQEVTWFTGGE